MLQRKMLTLGELPEREDVFYLTLAWLEIGIIVRSVVVSWMSPCLYLLMVLPKVDPSALLTYSPGIRRDVNILDLASIDSASRVEPF